MFLRSVVRSPTATAAELLIVEEPSCGGTAANIAETHYIFWCSYVLGLRHLQNTRFSLINVYCTYHMFNSW